MATPLTSRLALLAAVALVSSVVALGYQDDSHALHEVGDSQISPDGTSVLFTRTGAIWRIPYSGGDAQRLTPAESLNGRPRWSPDGKQIAFLHRASPADQAQIFIMPADGGEARAVSPASIDVLAFEWSPSGRRIAFVSGPITNPGGLWVMDANGSGPRMLRVGASTPFANSFAWAPDDSAIVRITGERSPPRPVPLRAEIIAVEGTTAPRVIARDVNPSVSWSRDGIIALSGRNRLLLASAPGFTIREVPLPADSALAYAVSLGNGQISLTFMGRQGSWIEHLTIATGERVTVMPPGIGLLFTVPSWSLDATRFVVTAHNESHVSEVYAGTLPLPESGRPDFVGARPPPVRQLTFNRN